MTNHTPQNIDPELLTRFLSEETSAEETRSVTQWLESDKQNRQYFEELSRIWKASADAGKFQDGWQEEDWKKVQFKIKSGSELKSRSQHRKLMTQVMKVAAAVTLLMAFYFLIQMGYKGLQTNNVIVSSGDSVKTVNLPDGSVVTLNSHSQLTYPETFDDTQRDVSLMGEAFFEVAENKLQPFIIETGAAKTEVVGTSFNISTVDLHVSVTVVTGKVLLYESRADAITLTSGERGVYSDGQVQEQPYADTNFLSWKTNSLVFKETPLSDVVDDLNRHYHKRVQLGPDALSGCTLTSTFENLPLETIINELEILFSAQVEKRGDAIIIQGKSCR